MISSRKTEFGASGLWRISSNDVETEEQADSRLVGLYSVEIGPAYMVRLQKGEVQRFSSPARK
jgi:hypothetical protein